MFQELNDWAGILAGVIAVVAAVVAVWRWARRQAEEADREKARSASAERELKTIARAVEDITVRLDRLESPRTRRAQRKRPQIDR